MTTLHRTKIKPQTVATYADIQIIITERAAFQPVGDKATELFAKHEQFDSIDQLCREIDLRMAQRAKNMKAKLSLEVITANGKPARITGIHMGTGHVIGSNGGVDFFPAVDWITEDIVRQEALNIERQAIQERLHKVKIKEQRSWGKPEPSQYQRLVTVLQEEFAAKSALAAGGREAADKGGGDAES